MSKGISLQGLKKAIKRQPLIKKAVKAFKIKRFNEFPSRVIIESTSRCNSRCITCEHKNMARAKQDMTMELFEKIINECAKYKDSITNLNLSFIGEPLLDPNIFKKIKIAKARGMKQISFICNGSLLTEENSRLLIDSGLDTVTFSVDGATKESFENIRVGLSYESVVANIRRFVELKKSLGSKKPNVSIDMVEMESNKAEADSFRRQWEGLADDVSVRPLHVWSGNAIDKKLLDYSRNTLPADRLRRPCIYLWKSMFISQSGKVALCCMDVECQESYGDVSKDSIRDIWRGDKLKKIRESHLDGEFGKTPLCGRCNFYLAKGLPWWWL